MEPANPSGFLECDFNASFFTKVVKNICENATFLGHKELSFSSEEGGLSGISGRSNNSKARVVGFRIFELRYIQPDQNEESRTRVVFKVKIKGCDTMDMMTVLFSSLGCSDIDKTLREKPFDTLKHLEQKELAFFNVDHPTWKAIRPKAFMTLMNATRHIYLVAMEDLRSGSFTHLDTVMDPSPWQRDDVKDALQGIAAFHALYYGNVGTIPEKVKGLIDSSNIEDPYNAASARAFFRCVVENIQKKHGNLLGEKAVSVLQKSINNMDKVCAVLSNSMTTLIHGDFNIRNVCLRKDPKPGESRMRAYDWEFLRVMCPQHDAAFFIAHILSENDPIDVWSDYFEMYRQCFLAELIKAGATEDIQGTVKDRDNFKWVFDMCIIEMLWNGVGVMLIVSKAHPLPFIPKLVKSVCRYLEYLSTIYAFLSDDL